jgi:hypothetical protein
MRTIVNSVSLYLAKILFITAIALNSMSCGNKQPAADKKFEKETEVLSWYFNKLGHKIGTEKHSYYLLPSVGCAGCRVNFDAYYSQPQNASDNITVIMTQRRYDSLTKELVLKTIVDTANIMDNLNWDYVDIIYIETENEEVRDIHSLNSQDILELIGHK